jgi:TRAP-type mannitol/chloroaromatic compound transport system permease small subunit
LPRDLPFAPLAAGAWTRSWEARLRALDRTIGALVAAARWLVLPVVALLFLQWPLRDLVQGYSREANDLGQVLFAVFVAVAVTAATRAEVHLSADGFARRFTPELRHRIGRLGMICVLLPWGVLVLVAIWPTVRSSVAALERFPDTSNPGYFVVKTAAALLALLVIAQGVVTASGADRDV